MAKVEHAAVQRRAGKQEKPRTDDLLFEDSGELDHVIESLNEHAKLVGGSLPQDRIDSWRGHSPLAFLEKRLREILTDAGVNSSDMKDANEVWWLLQRRGILNNKQEACARALLVVYTIKTPDDLIDYVTELVNDLRRVHAVLTDDAINKDRQKSQQAALNAQQPRQDALDKEIKKILERRPDATAKDVLDQLAKDAGPGQIVYEIGKSEIAFYEDHELRTAKTSGLKDRVSRIKKRQRLKNNSR